MIDRGTVLRGFFALFLFAVIGAFAFASFNDIDGNSGHYVGDGTAYGPIFEQPQSYRQQLLADRWVREIPVTHGTFGTAIQHQVRIGIDGVGPIPERQVTLQTPPAVQLFDGDQRQRAERLLHGMETVLEQRHGLLQGVSFTESRGGYEAAAIAGPVERRATDGAIDKADQQYISELLHQRGIDLADHAYAYYDDESQWIVLGPDISKRLMGFVRTPWRVTPEGGLFAAFVLRHELEHAITPAAGDNYEQLQWMEEGLADTLARWPGAAAATAKATGMPYPKKYEKLAYNTDRGGYPDWVVTIRVLLTAAGVDVQDPKSLDEATELLQGKSVEHVPTLLAERIGKRNRLTPLQTQHLAAKIARLDGSASRARKLVRSLH